MFTLLIIDDEAGFRRSLCDFFSGRDAAVFEAGTGAEGLLECARRKTDVVILDQRLPDGEGASLCARILEFNPRTKIVFITAFPNFENVVTALRAGAYDYLSKPIELDELALVIERGLALTKLEGIAELNQRASQKECENAVLLGEEGGLRETRALADLTAGVDAPVLITGETGTGKNLLAKYIHYRGTDPARPFVSVNVAAIPRDLMESELFGHERGAFSGAAGSRRGLFELADGGTIFLDEIGNLTPDLQAKMLTVLEDKQVRRVGSERTFSIRVRVISATNTDLRQAINAHLFREDFFYRLNVVHIHIPPLRERREDIPALCRYFVKQMAGRREAVLSEEEIRSLCAYDWPGNVRELRNLIERAVTLQRGSQLQPSLFLRPAGTNVLVKDPVATDLASRELSPLAEVERDHILRVLAHVANNQVKAARVLGISESTLRRRIKEFTNKADPVKMTCQSDGSGP